MGVNYIMNGDYIVCTMGTLSHYSVFAKEEARITILLREPETRVYPQLIINKVCDFDWYIVEVTKTLLPTTHARSFSLFAPTVFFQEYLEYVHEPYSKDELNDFVVSDEMFMDYIKGYLLAYSDPSRFSLIAQRNMFDVIRAMNLAINDKLLELPVHNMTTSESVALNIQQSIDKIHSLKSWQFIERIKGSRGYQPFIKGLKIYRSLRRHLLKK